MPPAKEPHTPTSWQALYGLSCLNSLFIYLDSVCAMENYSVKERVFRRWGEENG